MKYMLLLALIFTPLLPSFLHAEEKAGTQQQAELDTKIPVRLKYLRYLPKAYDEQDKWPVLLFLHGSGERGDDLELVKKHGPPKLIAEGKDFPFIVISPQCPKNRRWESIELMALLDDVAEHHKVDPDRIYVTGLSMGGYGTWALAAFAPERLAAIAPICGGGETFWTRSFAHLPVWAFHGAKDTGVPLARSESMVEALTKNGGSPKLTVYPEAGHDAWTETYNNPEFYTWLLEQRRPKSDDQAQFNRWEKEISRFEELDKQQPPTEGGIVFIGSSSIRLWKLSESFPDMELTNRGFGGSQIADSTHFADRILLNYKPRLVVLYAGDNDIASGKSAERVTADFQKFVARVHGELPKTKIVFVAIKPSLKRWQLYPAIQSANNAIAKLCNADETLVFLDIAKPMLGDDGTPRPELFVQDGLHMSPAGYQVWADALRPYLK